MAVKTITKMKAAELDALGMPLTAICKSLNLNYNTLSSWRNNDKPYLEARESYMAASKKVVQDHLKVAALEAYSTLVMMLNDDDIDAALKASVAQDLLDRIGIVKQAHLNHSHRSRPYRMK